MSRVEAPNCVTIFGGGISGLTAAHELVERGFRVQVWEPESDQRFPARGCDVGGMARTQWSRVHWNHTRDATQVRPLVNALPWELRRTKRSSASGSGYSLPRDPSDDPQGHVWCAFPTTDVFVSAQQIAQRILARVPLDDDEAQIDVEMRFVDPNRVGSAATKTAVALGKFTRLSEVAPRKDDLDSTLSLLMRAFGAERTSDKCCLVVPRIGGYPVRLRIFPVPEDPWIAEVMNFSPPVGASSESRPSPDGQLSADEAHALTQEPEDLRLVFHYSRPWGEPAEPIVDLPQKGYLRCPKNGPAVPPGWAAPESEGKGGKADLGPLFLKLAEEFAEADFNEDAVKNLSDASQFLWNELSPDGLTRYGHRSIMAAMKELAADIYRNPQIQHIYIEVADRHFRPESDWNLPIVTLLRVWMQKAIHQAYQDEHPGEGSPQSLIPPRSSPPNEDLHGHLHLAFRFPDGRIFVVTAVRLKEFPYISEPEEQEDFANEQRDGAREGAAAWDGYDIVMSVRVREHWLPGEHGYRFFPAFYHHVFDTMRRTPVLEQQKKSSLSRAQEVAMQVPADEYKYIETFRVVLDNVRSQKYAALAFADGKKPPLFNRSAINSMEKALEMFRSLTGPVGRGGLGVTAEDMLRMTLRTLQYITSSSVRRDGYENMTWMEFIHADTLSPEAQAAVKQFPRALVAMDASEGDARTLGSAGFQTTLDQLASESEFRDGTLFGPTSEAWFKYWRQYLEAQGVEFIHGKLVGFEEREVDNAQWEFEGLDATRMWPVVECYEPRFPFQGGKVALGEPCLMPGYFVLALPALEIRRVARSYREKYGKSYPHRDLERAADLDLGDPSDVIPKGELRHFAGVQFYFQEDVLWLDGHVYFPDSPWNLTSISQARFWADKHDWEHGYRGIMSVIIGRWDAPGTGNGKTAWECSPDELIAEVWHQLREGLERRDSRLGSRLPRPLYWHLDDFLTPWGNGWKNASPFQIERPGNFKNRPGDLSEQGYCVDHGIGLCGTYMKTHTRITTMESANESGRHVVNAILRDIDSPFRRTPCEIFPIEEREIHDFDFLKKLDEQLCEAGLPHVLDILGIDEVIRRLYPQVEKSLTDSADLFVRYGALVRDWCTTNFPRYRNQGGRYGR